MTNYLPVGGNRRHDLEVNSDFSRVYDNILHRYLSIPLSGMRTSQLFSFSLSLSRNAMLFWLGPFTLASTRLFFPCWEMRGKKAGNSYTLHAGDVDLRVLCPRNGAK